MMVLTLLTPERYQVIEPEILQKKEQKLLRTKDDIC